MPFDFDKPRKIAYCDGPTVNGVEQVAKFSTRWAAWVGDTGVRVGKYDAITLPSNNLGEKSTLYGNTKPEHLTLGFTKAGFLGIAIEKDKETVELKLYTADGMPDGVFSTFTWLGRSPLLFNNWLLYWDTTGGDKFDLVCYYLSVSVPNVLLARFQREAFAVEHIIHEDLPVDIAYLIQTDVYQETKQIMYLRTTDGGNGTLYSEDYGFVANDQMELGVEFVEGEYVETAVPMIVEPEDYYGLTIEQMGIFKSIVAIKNDFNKAIHNLKVQFVQGTYE